MEKRTKHTNAAQLSRRAVLRLAGAGLAACWWSERAAAAAIIRKIPIAVQLYSVRTDCAQDFDAALARVAKMGFTGVEFAGYHSYSGKPAELRKRLDDLGLKVAGTHIGTGTLRGDALKKTVEFHQTIGCKFLIVPGDGAFTDPEKSKELADLFNQTAAALKPLGMACGYHNHTRELQKAADKTYWDLFAERTTPDVVLQQDCGWTAAAGLDPVALIRRYPGRTRTTHFKPTVVRGDAGKKAYLGQDSVDWAAVYRACATVGGTEWIIIEQETYPDGKSPMECTELSLAGLRKVIQEITG
ncbi:MAG: sugar phosphate isomerase/epimerase [Armatimonadota bacterium]|nr:sugar phosphate isomerase/epimerase [Armatimonadota bacterium]